MPKVERGQIFLLGGGGKGVVRAPPAPHSPLLELSPLWMGQGGARVV